MQLLHPFMPFITEEIYHLLKERNDDLIVKQFSPAEKPDVDILKSGDKLKALITAIRDARNKNNLKPKESISLFIETTDEISYQPLKNILSKQVNADAIFFNEKPGESSVTIVVGNEKIYLLSDAETDTEAQKEKLNKDLQYLKGFLISVDRKLSNDKFVQNAKPQVIELERKKKSDAEEKIRIIEQSLATIG